MRKITKKRAHQIKFTKCLSKPNNCARMCSTKWTLPLKKQNIPSIIAFERKTSRKWNCLTPFLHPNFHKRKKPFPKESWCIWIMFSCYYVARILFLHKETEAKRVKGSGSQSSVLGQRTWSGLPPQRVGRHFGLPERARRLILAVLKTSH